MEPCAILFNFQAGALRLSPDLDQIKSLAKEIGVKATYYQPTDKGEMARQVRALAEAGVPQIVVAGGDGTVSLAAQILAGRPNALGIIPLGTANNFATALHLPQDLPSALRVIQEGQIESVSLGKIGDRYFTEAAGVGLFADALALYGKGSNKNLLRALYAFARLFLAFPRHRLKITLDGEPLVERALLCTVANTFRFGTAYPLAPNARLTDNHLDVVVVTEMRRRDLWPFYRLLRAQLHTSLPHVTTYTAREIKLESLEPLNVHADDSIVGTTPVSISVAADILKVIVDRL